ncbi:MAG: alkaline phosphatase [Endomicrobiaceae bacterium]|nr:alkaline phosphatase [Endomicrobiaceae bacterium]
MKFLKIFCLFILLFTASNLIGDISTKYVFLFIGDGMSISGEFATSLYLYGTDKKLIWNSFPVKFFSTTWSLTSINKSNPDGYDTSSAGLLPYPYYSTELADNYFKNTPPTDSSASATAMSTGYKIQNGVVCIDNNGKSLQNIFDILNKKNIYNTCLITTTLFYSATPASFSSHNISRNNYKEIAEEILSVTKPEIIIGCNEYFYLNDFVKQNGYYIADSIDIKNTLPFYTTDKKIFVTLSNYSVPQPKKMKNNPGFSYKDNALSFSDIVTFATIKLLEKKKPFLAVIEQSDIDSANHDNDYHSMVGSVYELHDAVNSLIKLIQSNQTDMNWQNTLVIVTADHATGMLRFNENLAKGQLPHKMIFAGKNLLKIDRTVKYKSKNHTNELVGLYAIGAGSELFNKYIGLTHKNSQIIDNTDIFKVLKEVTTK